jgi:ATP-dependent Lon protease
MRRLAKIAETESPVQIPGKPDTEQSKISAEVADALELTKRHISILYGDTGYSYESIMTPYLRGAKGIVIEDPYIRLPHQIHNFVRFCETALKVGTIKKIQPNHKL